MRPLFSFLAVFFVFHVLFWQEALGINLVFFGWSLLFLTHFRHRHRTLYRYQYALIILAITSGIAVITVNTTFSNTLFFFITITTCGSWHFRTAFEGLTNGILQFFDPRQGLVPGWRVSAQSPGSRGVLYLRIGIIPLMIFFIYFLLFSAGNSIFHRWSSGFLQMLENLFTDLSPKHTAFVILAIIVSRWVVRSQWAQVFRLSVSESLQRKTTFKFRRFKMMGLKHEYLSATVLLFLLNGLFLVVNGIDIKWVWFQFYVPEAFNLKEFVHEGVGWLIFTLLISIGVILFYFRGNLNFYRDGGLLKKLAILWIVQNGILAISVMLRTFYYIGFHGLASKRIGVLLFVSLVLFGLASLAFKILQNRNSVFVIRVNTLFMIGFLTLASCVPWNRVMVSYNLAHSNVNEIDVDYYLELDPQVYPLLFRHLNLIENQIRQHQKNERVWISYASINDFKARLEENSGRYMNLRRQRGPASWSWADQRAEGQLAQLGF